MAPPTGPHLSPFRRQSRQEKLYQAKLESLELFVRVIAHDLNGPLTGLNLTLQACKKLAKTAAMHKLLDTMDHDLSSATRLLEELKSLNKREIFRPQPLDISSEIAKLAEQVSATPRLPITIEVSAEAGRLPVAGDLSRLRRAWQNIIRNVIDAAEARGGEKVKLNIFTRRTGNFVRIQFADNAGGIARSRVSRVFEPFFTTRGEKNRGLGLFIARKIVGEHAGKIRVVSKKPFTRVTIDLPLMP